MKSSDRSDRLDLEHGLPTTPEDSEALRRAKARQPTGLRDYLRFLSQFPPCDQDELRSRQGPRAASCFTID